MVAILVGLTSAACPASRLEGCGDGRVSDSEACDDGNLINGDGCSERCQQESELNRREVCGNGLLEVGEDCDDANLEGGDGCTPACRVFQGWSCTGQPSRCAPVCGDGIRLTEACEDGNLEDGDGCSARCTVELGWTCDDGTSSCVTTCGDGHRVGAESCDDGNMLAGDGCSPTCVARDFWVPISSSAIFEKSAHSAVWNGTEMLIWGGDGNSTLYGTGFRYSPVTGVPRPIATTGAPSSRIWHTTVQVGEQMLVWGGSDRAEIYYNSGALYDPSSDSWRPLSTDGAPSARLWAVGVWTGSEVLIFGGKEYLGGQRYNWAPVADGARYDLARDLWTPMSVRGGPSPAQEVRGVWSGTEMIVISDQTAFAYDPAMDRWRDLNMPSDVIARPLFVDWAGDALIVIGAFGNLRYDLAQARWSRIASYPGDLAQSRFVATGSEVVGYADGVGHRYVPALDRWFPMAPWSPGRLFPSLVWTGREILVWGGVRVLSANPYSTETYDTGGRYDPTNDRWTDLAFSQQGRPLRGQSAVWTGAEMLTFGGRTSSEIMSRETFAFLPSNESWRVLSSSAAPARRSLHGAVWTGDKMLVWGGVTDDFRAVDDGGEYDLATDTWSPLPTQGAPAPRQEMLTVWTGREMLVWGGWRFNPGGQYLDIWGDGALYDPVRRVWRRMSSHNALPRGGAWSKQRGVWTGTEVILWHNEYPLASQLPSDDHVIWATYSPSSNTWGRLSSEGAPVGQGYGGVWTGEELIVLGQDQASLSGGRYHLETRVWSPISLPENFAPRTDPHAIWTGREMIVWGGKTYVEGFNGTITVTQHGDGARYDPATDTWTPLPGLNGPVGRAQAFALWTGNEMIIWGDGASGARFLR